MTRQTVCLAVLCGVLSGWPWSAQASTALSRDAARPDADGEILWYDAALLGVRGKGWADTESAYDRLPRKAMDMVRGPVWGLSRCSAGMEVHFLTDAGVLRVRWTLNQETIALPHMPATGVSGMDLYARDETGRLRFRGNGRPHGLSNEASFTLPAGKELVLYLPLYNGVKRLELGIPADKTLWTVPMPPLSRATVFYGTSITQGACASRPGMAATAIVGRALDVPVINLGFSGQGQMEMEMAELLSELDPAVYVLDCLWNMTPRMVSDRVVPFVRRMRETRPETPILLVEDSSIGDRPTEKGDMLRKLFAQLVEGGDANLFLLPNKGMLGEDMDGTVDGCHPNDLGMARQAAIFVRCLGPIVEKRSASPSIETEAAAPGPNPPMTIVEVRRIWDQAPHNAFTDLIRFNDTWYCAFREGAGHVSDDGSVRVIKSPDGKDWSSVARMEWGGGDVRDAKLSVTFEGQLMLNGAVRFPEPVDGNSHQSVTWLSGNGKDWSEPMACPSGLGTWRWSVTWHKGIAYSFGYSGKDQGGCLYRSRDGRTWETVQDDVYPDVESYGNETSLVFLEDDSAFCLLRRDKGSCSALLGMSRPPFTEWAWTDLGIRIGGPKMIPFGEDRFLAAVRLYDEGPRTSLCWIGLRDGTLTEALKLPSGGDTSYAGLVMHDGLLWVSYYSSHEDKTAIYLAKVRIGE